MKPDAIDIVEAAYDIDSDDAAWFDRLVALVRPRLDRGAGITAWRYRSDADFVPQDIVRSGDGPALDAVLKIARHERDLRREFFRAPRPLATGAQNFGLDPREARRFRPFVEHLHPAGVRDVVTLTALDASGRGLIVCAPQPDLRRPSRAAQEHWGQLSAHISAGARLRDRLDGQRPGLRDADAILDAAGKVVDARDRAASRGAREELRTSARVIDRARGRLRRTDPQEALRLWRGLVDGEWSLVDHFDTDGRRYLVARKNAPDVRDPRALSPRERQVLACTARGHTLKLIAYELGLSLPTIAEARTRAMRKLGLRSVADVVAAFAPGPR